MKKIAKVSYKDSKWIYDNAVTYKLNNNTEKILYKLPFKGQYE